MGSKNPNPLGLKMDMLIKKGKELNLHDDLNIIKKFNINHLVEKAKNLDFEINPFDIRMINLVMGGNTKLINDKLSKTQELNEFDEMLIQFFGEALSKLPKCTDEYVYRMDTFVDLSNIHFVEAWWSGARDKIVKIPWFLATSKVEWDDYKLIWRINVAKNTNAHQALLLAYEPWFEKEIIFQKGSKFKVEQISKTKDEILIDLIEVLDETPSVNLLANSYFEKSLLCNDEEGLFD